jgi:carbon storage regulator CsrA
MTTVEILLKRRQVFDLTPDIRVIILSVDGDKCRIGIEAPDHIRILRSELVEVINGSMVESNSGEGREVTI